LKLSLLLPLLLLFTPAIADSKASKHEKRASFVNTSTVTKGDVFSLNNYNGTLFFKTKSNLATRTEGLVKKVYFDEGSLIQKGDLLLELDDELSKLSLEIKKASNQALQAQTDFSQSELTRTKTLFQKKRISVKEYELALYKAQELQAKLQQSHFELEDLTLKHSYKKIVAPYDGVILKRYTQTAQWLKQGDMIATLAQTAPMEAHFFIPTHYFEKLTLNDTLDITIDKKIYTGKISAKIPLANQSSRTFNLKVALNAPLIEGGAAAIKLTSTQRQNALLVPRDTVIKRFGKNVVFTVDKDKALMHSVIIKGYTQNKIAISCPTVHLHDTVITKGHERLIPNALVAIKGN
jgi:RND family efflux transporter MFP subunit